MSRAPRKIYRVAGITLGLGLFCVLLVLVGGLGHRFELLHFRTSFSLMNLAVWLAPIVTGLALVIFLVSFLKGAKARAYSMAFMGLCLALSVYIPNRIFKTRASSLPKIHDITTDTENPPSFVKAQELRGPEANSLAYEGTAIAHQQKTAYPDIEPVLLPVGKEEAFRRALARAEELGWAVIDANAGEGRIEATDTTLIFGFKDDVVIRLSEVGNAQTKVDVRSVSRVGLSDVGANASRIRKFLQGLRGYELGT